ncbi:hypothetical protein HNQ93_002608 [Hymenobacter luteus]|uniref:Uncharacterized protein n=2 Tax=Hymenobacter TaxID=89966 RepID=A0A7W9T2X8_9BACT|nr:MULTISPECIES: hypothetical protein [Hymenobacter]MBB4601823.1 hypothetical protein [Hymenobacter latericoloratus]MBB6059748.1 hypothetical protein [Hymenobacter luteus]
MRQHCAVIIGGLILLSACHDKSKKVADTATKPATPAPSQHPAATSTKTFLIDTLAILTNRNLDKLLLQIEQDSLIESRKTRDIPPIIQSFLNQHGSFTIADYGQPFNATDNIVEERPNRQLLYLGIGNQTVLMTYYLGGFGLSERVLLFEVKDNNITDFWTGYLNPDAFDKRRIIQVLRANKDKSWGVNTNALYL